MPSGTASIAALSSCMLLWRYTARCALGTPAMRIARMMQLWFSSSPIQ